jgi:hypothetical protein
MVASGWRRRAAVSAAPTRSRADGLLEGLVDEEEDVGGLRRDTSAGTRGGPTGVGVGAAAAAPMDLFASDDEGDDQASAAGSPAAAGSDAAVVATAHTPAPASPPAEAPDHIGAAAVDWDALGGLFGPGGGLLDDILFGTPNGSGGGASGSGESGAAAAPVGLDAVDRLFLLEGGLGDDLTHLLLPPESHVCEVSTAAGRPSAGARVDPAPSPALSPSEGAVAEPATVPA